MILLDMPEIELAIETRTPEDWDKVGQGNVFKRAVNRYLFNKYALRQHWRCIQHDRENRVFRLLLLNS